MNIPRCRIFVTMSAKFEPELTKTRYPRWNRSVGKLAITTFIVHLVFLYTLWIKKQIKWLSAYIFFKILTLTVSLRHIYADQLYSSQFYPSKSREFQICRYRILTHKIVNSPSISGNDSCVKLRFIRRICTQEFLIALTHDKKFNLSEQSLSGFMMASTGRRRMSICQASE